MGLISILDSVGDKLLSRVFFMKLFICEGKTTQKYKLFHYLSIVPGAEMVTIILHGDPEGGVAKSLPQGYLMLPRPPPFCRP